MTDQRKLAALHARIHGTDVTNEDLRDFCKQMAALELAIRKARIPKDLLWGAIMLTLAADYITLTGMPVELYLSEAVETYEPAEPAPLRAARLAFPDDILPFKRRLRDAILPKFGRVEAGETAVYLTQLAKQIYSNHGIPKDLFVGIVKAAIEDGGRNLRAAAKKHQA